MDLEEKFTKIMALAGELDYENPKIEIQYRGGWVAAIMGQNGSPQVSEACDCPWNALDQLSTKLTSGVQTTIDKLRKRAIHLENLIFPYSAITYLKAPGFHDSIRSIRNMAQELGFNHGGVFFNYSRGEWQAITMNNSPTEENSCHGDPCDSVTEATSSLEKALEDEIRKKIQELNNEARDLEILIGVKKGGDENA